MSSLSELTVIAFVFAPLVLTAALLAGIVWFKTRGGRGGADGPERLLSAALEHMPAERSEWGEAMMAELVALRGRSFRWWFALGCVRAALFPPRLASWPRYWWDALKRLGSVCGVLSVALPPLGLPLMYACAIAADAFTTHDNFFNGELVPGMIGAGILLSIAFALAGLPLGIVGLVRRERVRWLSMMGPALSLSIVVYFAVVMHVANGGVPD